MRTDIFELQILNTGIVSSLLFVLLHFSQGIIGWIQPNWPCLNLIFALAIPTINIMILTILWVVLVKFYEQSKLDFILKAMIIASTVITLLSLVLLWYRVQMIFILLIISALFGLIFYVVFIFRIMNMDHSKIHQINQLKNFGVAFTICIFSQLVLSIIVEVSGNTSLGNMTYLLRVIPVIFIILFFWKTKYYQFIKKDL